MDISKMNSEDRALIKRHGMIITKYIKHIIENDIVVQVNSLVDRLDEVARDDIRRNDMRTEQETLSYWIVSRRFASFLTDIHSVVTDIDGTYIWHKDCGNSMNEDPSVIEFAKSWI